MHKILLKILAFCLFLICLALIGQVCQYLNEFDKKITVEQYREAGLESPFEKKAETPKDTLTVSMDKKEKDEEIELLMDGFLFGWF